MSKNNFKVQRGFWMDGQAHQAGESISIDDPELVGVLMDGQKIEPADQATAGRIKSRLHHEWRRDRDAALMHAPAARVKI